MEIIMAPVTIYTRDGCGYCSRARHLLQAKQIEFDELNAGNSNELRDEMVERSGRQTFPQIFIHGKHIGGCDEMLALDAAGKLDGLLFAPETLN
jgi:glutaredoxin 3